MYSNHGFFAFGLGALLILGLLIWAPTAWSHWDPNNPNTKWVQLPDETNNGIDVAASNPSLADDFRCTDSGPITGIHIWGSFLNDQVYQPTFLLAIWSNIPKGGGGYSIPDIPLWEAHFSPSQYSYRQWKPDLVVTETFLDPVSKEVLGHDKQIYQFNFHLEEPYNQEEGTIYWLSVWATAGTQGELFGWKTSEQPTWQDAAVFGHPMAWLLLFENRSQSDMAFVITTPIPGSLLLLGSGLLGLGAVGWRRRKKI